MIYTNRKMDILGINTNALVVYDDDAGLLGTPAKIEFPPLGWYIVLPKSSWQSTIPHHV